MALKRRSRADAEKALAQMSGVVLGSRRIRCGWAQHKQETSSASYAAVDRVSCLSHSCVSLQQLHILVLAEVILPFALSLRHAQFQNNLTAAGHGVNFLDLSAQHRCLGELLCDNQSLDWVLLGAPS